IIDNENNLWVVTYQGLFNLFERNFLTYKLPEATDAVRTVFRHPEKDAVIAGTLQGKIFEIDSKGGSREVPYPPNPYGTAFFFDHSAVTDGVMYLPGPGDILKIGKREKRWMNLPWMNTPCFVIALHNGNLLEGCQSGLIEFTPQGNVVKNFAADAMRQAVVAKPCFDARGRLWFGGIHGISIYDYDAQCIVDTIFNDSVQRVRHMGNDADRNVWFSSENRLFVSSGDTVRLERTFPQGINGIYFTRADNRMIVLTQSGFYLFDKNRQESIFYNHENGYMGEESTSGAIAEDAAGNIYLPSLAGLVRFNPRKMAATAHKPELQLISVSSSIDNIHWKSIADSISTLNYRDKNIRFGYIGLSYSQAQNVRYHYRLLGFQNEWSQPSADREVTFNNLRPGSYTFEIYADAGTNELRGETRSFSFSILPAFWQTTWFLVACIVFLIMASAGVALYIQRRKNKILLERLRAEKELNELRISSIRLKAIPHFNANVLAAIEYYITNRTREEAMHVLGIYSDFTYMTLNEVDKAARPLDEELAYVKMYLDLEKVRFLDKFDFAIEVEEDVDKSVKLPNMILHTYCENAVKHGLMPLKSDGRLTIHVSQHEQTVCVSVEDNGVGRTYAARHPQLHSTKQGLSILNRQIEIYNRFNQWKISQQIEDLASGTRFTVEIPLAYTYIN
ncbi:sensor histidine kinase, partial [Bacteroides sp. UBA939]|uniref:sensor histidine kinase n=1 Tax=Bacteroides sp. UBA939 TaxID=1946092 RepID=UPI0025C73475